MNALTAGGVPPSTRSGCRIEIRGIVQGVGFRPWIYRLAMEHGLAGHVRNTASGVAIDAFGSEEALDTFVRCVETSPPPPAVIRELRSSAIRPEPVDTFSILHSEERIDRRISIPADLPTCRACLSELFDPTDRRYRYPFINCTNCGPRFTIARDVPYDRAATTMAPFRMCENCQREYDTVGDRRFHTQPNACPVCGPQIALLGRDGRVIDCEDPVVAVASALLAGRIVAIKGLGGFHLACDATSSDAVQRLRVRKRRDEKPFAVMVKDVADARAVAVVTDEEQQLLESMEHPIVLSKRRDECLLAPEIAPGNPLIGLLLPYTPLHHLILREVGRPMVMTSGNLSDEPIAHRNEEALARLGNVADLFLIHDREIETPCDDSVARMIDRHPTVLRRARGYVPRPNAVSPAFDRPVLACGALLKNAFCIGAGEAAYLGPHVGDLENLETYQSYESSITRMERFIRVAPEIIAYDLHPDYLSTRYALARPEPLKVGVQHHHAHVASVMAEHQLSGPVIGVAYDGTGYGTDGASWGGEVLLTRYDTFERVATLRPIPLPGGDAAVRHPWRIALALVDDAFGGAAPLGDLPVFSIVRPHDLSVIRAMLATGFRSPLAHGCGRYFDGIGSLVLGRLEARYEGQIALEWNLVADPSVERRYGYEVDWQQSPWTIDFRPMVRAVVHDLREGVSASSISARFHNTIVAATTETVRAAVAIHGTLPVVLTGGCFQNARLTESLAQSLRTCARICLHHEVPPGDGGLALGQAVVAAAVARRTCSGGS
jgi:hydrogenase maturation protein HypF